MVQNRIKVMCAEAGISVAELAETLAMEPHTLRRYARQESQPKPDLAIKISKHFNKDIDEVLGIGAGTQKEMFVYRAVSGGYDLERPVGDVIKPDFMHKHDGDCCIVGTRCGVCLSPRVRAGQTVYIDQVRPPLSGDLVMLVTIGSPLGRIREYIQTNDDDSIRINNVGKDRLENINDSEIEILDKIVAVVAE